MGDHGATAANLGIRTFIMQHRLAFVVIAAGVATFLGALYGAFGAASTALAAVGLGCLAIGLAWLAMSLRSAAFGRPAAMTVGLVALGVVLHAYEQAQGSGSISVLWFSWALLPYAVCLVAATLPATRVPSIAGATVVLLLDLWVYYDVFVHPMGSTAALALVFIPLWSTLVFAPLVMFLAWLAGRCIRLRGNAP